MDGTIADLYSVPGWLPMLLHENAAPYMIAKPIGDASKLNGLIAALKGYGYTVEVVSWLAKGTPSSTFNKAVRRNKCAWLKKYLPAIDMADVHIIKHGTNKWQASNYKGGILFDDENPNIENWIKHTNSGHAVQVKDSNTVISVLEQLITKEVSRCGASFFIKKSLGFSLVCGTTYDRL